MLPMAKNIIYISEAEAASDFAAVLARVRAGAEIVIEGHEPVVVVRSRAGAWPVALRVHRTGQSTRGRNWEGPCPRSRLRGRCGRDRQEPQSVEPARVGIILDSSVIITERDVRIN